MEDQKNIHAKAVELNESLTKNDLFEFEEIEQIINILSKQNQQFKQLKYFKDDYSSITLQVYDETTNCYLCAVISERNKNQNFSYRNLINDLKPKPLRTILQQYYQINLYDWDQYFNCQIECSKLTPKNAHLVRHLTFQVQLTSNFDQMRECVNLQVLIVNFQIKLPQEKLILNLAKELPKFEHLICLKINAGRMQLKCSGLSILSQEIANCKRLQFLTLYLNDSQIEKLGVTNLSIAISQIQTLQGIIIYLEKNYITEGLIELGKSFAQLKNLRYISINVSFNQINSYYLYQFESYIAQCQSLIEFSLFSCNMYIGQDLLAYGKKLSECQNLNVCNIYFDYGQKQKIERKIYQNLLKVKTLVDLVFK